MHTLQITIHARHFWQVTPGLPDKGGRSVYVNHPFGAFTRLGHQVIVSDRGGYPHRLAASFLDEIESVDDA